MSENVRNICQEITSDVYSVYECIGTVYTCMKGPSWQWSYGSWFYNYLCNAYHHIAAGLDMGVSGWYQCQCGKYHVMMWKIPCHNLFITYFSLTFFQALSFILQKRSLNWQIAKLNLLERFPCSTWKYFCFEWFQKDIKQCRSVQWR